MTVRAEGNYGQYAISDRDGNLQGLEGGHLIKADLVQDVHLFPSLPSMSAYSNALANEGYYIVDVVIRCSRA